MKYRSTRGGGGRSYSFEEAVLSGYTSDGGLLMPENIPTLTQEQLRTWATLSYPELVKKILPLFVDDTEIPTHQLNGLLDKAFSRFAIPDVVQLVRLSSDLNVLELFHGVTLAFKDLALSCVGQFLDYFLQKRKKHVTILIGTSGDTGSAAIEGVRGLKWVDIVVLLPMGRCSRIQELQMTTVIDDNVHIFRVDGTSDNLDEPIKRCFTDAVFMEKHQLCSINSINWARIMMQIAHYFYAYFQLNPGCDGEVEIAIPTGACGNVTAGCIAREMGLPVKLVCAVNINDIVARTLENGDFSVTGDVIQSLAPAMDIQAPYNVERLIYLYSGADSELVSKLMKQFEKEPKLQIPNNILQKIQEVMSSWRVDDAGIHEAMRRCWQENNYLLCPHTAVAANYHYNHPNKANNPSEMPRMCLATASPAKFEEAVLSAGLTPQPTDAVKALDKLPTKYVDMNQGDDWDKMLRETIEKIRAAREV